MSPRPRSISDADILDRALGVVRRRGPRVTLAEIALEAGLTSARLVQRFGSRDALITRVELRVDQKMKAAIVRAMARFDSPIEGLIEGLAEVSERNARRLHQLAHSYIYDPGDLSPAQARESKERWLMLSDAFRVALDRAIQVGELIPCDTERTARVVLVTWIGSYTVWAYAPVGSLHEMLPADLAQALSPFRATRSYRPIATPQNAR